jgi:hypothetical protein
MSTEAKKILEILSELESDKQMQVIIECASNPNIGSKEWQEAVKDLMQRMEKLDKSN